MLQNWLPLILSTEGVKQKIMITLHIMVFCCNLMFLSCSEHFKSKTIFFIIFIVNPFSAGGKNGKFDLVVVCYELKSLFLSISCPNLAQMMPTYVSRPLPNFSFLAALEVLQI